MTLNSWLEKVRRRVRLRRALGWAVWAGLAWGALALALMIAARLSPLGWERRAAWWGLPVAIVVGFVLGATRRLPLVLAARAADRDLAGNDRIATAAELAPTSGGALDERQVAETTRWATTSSLAKAAPLRVPKRPLASALALAACIALLTFLPNSMDEIIERRRTEQELVAATAEAIERDAEAIERAEELDPVERRRLVEQLKRLAEQLRESRSVQDALDELQRAETRLLAQQSGDHLAAKTLTGSFEQTLATQPLAPGAGDSVPEQLRALAAQTNPSEEQLQSAGERLNELAGALQSSDPALSSAIESAAAALASGQADPDALAQAAEAWSESQGRIAAQEAVASAGARLGSLQQGLAAAAAAQAQGQAQGQGQGQGQGPGQGPGSPGSQAGQGGSAGTNAPFGNPATGGAAQPDGSGFNPSNTKGAPVYDPVFGSGVAERLRVTGNRSGKREQIVGFEKGGGKKSPILVPYEQVYAQWSARAARSVEVLSIPASLRALVRDYFESLAPEEGP
ncbi:MAG: hypothetical protein ACRDKZ_05055 [Actinomycetota bacterium]